MPTSIGFSPFHLISPLYAIVDFTAIIYELCYFLSTRVSVDKMLIPFHLTRFQFFIVFQLKIPLHYHSDPGDLFRALFHIFLRTSFIWFCNKMVQLSSSYHVNVPWLLIINLQLFSGLSEDDWSYSLPNITDPGHFGFMSSDRK